MHADRANRFLLAALAVLMVLAGLAAILAGTRLFGADVPRRSLLDHAVGDVVGRNGDWFWPVAGLVALGIVALALWWLAKILFSTDRVWQIELPARAPGSPTEVSAGALARAVADEIEGYPGVSAARVGLAGTPQRPRLAVRVDADRRADVAGLRRRIEAGALADAREALEYPELPATLDLNLRRDGAAGTRVT